MTDIGEVPDSVRGRIASYDHRDLLRWALLAVLVLIVAPFVVFALPQVVGAEYSYVVLSGSMEPAISPGDVVVVNDVPAAQIGTGDVITFGVSTSEPATTHRVVDVVERDGERLFRTKGDNNEDADPALVPATDVAGRVMELPLPVVGTTLFVIPYVGHVVEFVDTTAGFALLVVAPLTLLAVTELWAAFRRRRDDGDGDEPGSADGDPAPSEATAVTLSSQQLAAAIGLLALVAAVAGWRAYVTMHPLAVGVLVAALGGGALLLGVSVRGSRERVTTDGGRVRSVEDAPSGDPTDDVIEGRVTSSLYRRGRVEIASLATLSELATGTDSWIVHDRSSGEYVLFVDGVAYVAPPDAGPDDAPPSSADGERREPATADTDGAGGDDAN